MRFIKEIEDKYSRIFFNKNYNELNIKEKEQIAREIFKDGE